jgi:hemolysin activation/secretion protein
VTPFASPTPRRARGPALLRASLLLAMALARPAFAQQAGAPSVPSGGAGAGLSTLPTVDRDRSDRTSPVLPAAPGNAPRLPNSTTSIAVTTAATAATLTSVRFEGATLSQAYLNSAVKPYIGKTITPENLSALATAVGTAYSKSDIAYYAVMIPAQVPTGGVLLVRVTEGAVTQYTLNGVAGAKATPRLAAQIRHIMADRPLHKSTLERAISLMRDLPGQTLNAQMRQVDTSGALVIDLTGKRKFANVAVTFNNDGVANVINSFQAQVAVTGNNLLRDGDRTTVSSYLPIHPDRYQFYSASHSTPIGESGLQFGLNGAYLRTKSDGLDIVGTAKLAGATLTYPIIRSYKTNLSAVASLDGVNSSNYFLDTRFGDYKARAARLGLNWSKSDDKNGYAVSAVVSQGLDALGAKAFTGYSEKSFTKANIQAIAVRTVAKNLSLKVSARAQYSKDQLPSTERIPIGGPGAGRAFRSGTIAAEKAIAGMVEVDWSLPTKAKLLKGTTLFAYADGAVAGTVARPVYGIPAGSFSLASVGAGVRVAVGEKWRASVEVAVPVKRPETFYSRKARLFVGFGRNF